MPPKKVTSYRELAEIAGVSKATVSLALRNHPKIAKQTRTRIQNLAQLHGYRANPLVSAQMAFIKQSKTQKRPIATIGLVALKSIEAAKKDPRIPLQYYYRGVMDRAKSLGFSIDILLPFQEGLDETRLGDILSARGIRGVIFMPLSLSGPIDNLRFDWDRFSVVAIENTFSQPRIHSVCNDEFESIGRMIRRLGRLGYRRIGIAMQEFEDAHVKNCWLAGYQAYNSQLPVRRRIPPHITTDWTKPRFLKWFEKYHPEVIICIDDTVYHWLREEGVRIPDEVGCATLYWLPNRAYLSGYYQNHEVMGAAAVDLLSAQLYHNDLGIPKHSNRLNVQSDWRGGETLRPECPQLVTPEPSKVS